MSQLLLAGSLTAWQAVWGGEANQPEGLAAGVAQAGPGDWVAALGERGIEFTGCLTAEVWGNTRGGVETGTVDTELVHLGVVVDLERLAGWQGASAGTNWLWLHGDDASAELTGNLLTVSNIAGYNTVRMFDLWVEQALLDDRLSLRLGQLSADSEFAFSDHAGLFINATFGWSPSMYLNLPGGGPGFPMGTLGLRVVVNPRECLTFQSAIYQGNVFAQEVNQHGFRWDPGADTGWTVFNEMQVRWAQGAGATGLPGQLKAGVWVQTGDQADGLDGSSDTNAGGYLVVDQWLWEEPGSGGSHGGAGESLPSQGLAGFIRLAGAPQDRNFCAGSVDFGVVYTGVFPGRDGDKLGLACGRARIGDDGRALTASQGLAPAASEMVIELSYQARLSPFLIIQPDIQYLIHPGGSKDLENALVVGMRASLTF